MVLEIWSRKQAIKFAMKTVDIPTTQEISHFEVTNEYNAHHFLQSQTN
jgi:hypothetical protein